jgi:hypothetical protein
MGKTNETHTDVYRLIIPSNLYKALKIIIFFNVLLIHIGHGIMNAGKIMSRVSKGS